MTTQFEIGCDTAIIAIDSLEQYSTVKIPQTVKLCATEVAGDKLIVAMRSKVFIIQKVDRAAPEYEQLLKNIEPKAAVSSSAEKLFDKQTVLVDCYAKFKNEPKYNSKLSGEAANCWFAVVSHQQQQIKNIEQNERPKEKPHEIQIEVTTKKPQLRSEPKDFVITFDKIPERSAQREERVFPISQDDMQQLVRKEHNQQSNIKGGLFLIGSETKIYEVMDVLAIGQLERLDGGVYMIPIQGTIDIASIKQFQLDWRIENLKKTQ